MPRHGIDKLALLVALGAIALVVVAAAGTGPAYSEDSRTAPAASHQVPSVNSSPALAIERSAASTASGPADASGTALVERQSDADGYQWSGSRPVEQRYKWSQGTS